MLKEKRTRYENTRYALAPPRLRNRTMTQRIFDVDNPQDVKDLFDIIPDRYIRITRTDPGHLRVCSTDYVVDFTAPIVINWRNKTEITRPVDETQWIGKLCWFWDKDEQPFIAVLKKIMTISRYKYTTTDDESYKYCRPVRRDEVKFAEDTESKE